MSGESNSYRDALIGLLERYTELVNCGDCGNWNPEEEDCVKAARAALAGSEPENDEAMAILRAINAEPSARLPQGVWNRLQAQLQREVDESRNRATQLPNKEQS